MHIELDEVSIRCMGCRENRSLDAAIAEDWRICDHCQFFICPFCMEHLGDSRYCLSYPCRKARREFALGPIPIERILVFARRSVSNPGSGTLLEKLFFASRTDFEIPFVLSARDDSAGQEGLPDLSRSASNPELVPDSGSREKQPRADGLRPGSVMDYRTR